MTGGRYVSVLGGESKPPFGAVRDVLEEQFARDEHIGAGVSIYHRGEKVVDLWGGLADEDAGTGNVRSCHACAAGG